MFPLFYRIIVAWRGLAWRCFVFGVFWSLSANACIRCNNILNYSLYFAWLVKFCLHSNNSKLLQKKRMSVVFFLSFLNERQTTIRTSAIVGLGVCVRVYVCALQMLFTRWEVHSFIFLMTIFARQMRFLLMHVMSRRLFFGICAVWPVFVPVWMRARAFNAHFLLLTISNMRTNQPNGWWFVCT